MIIVGIDAGGTKTLASVFDEQGEVIVSKSVGTCHYMQVGYEAMEDILKALFEDVLCDIKEPVHYCFGMAGYGQVETVRRNIDDVLTRVCHPYPFTVYNDVEVAMAGALGGQDGIVMIAGTGSIALSKFNRSFERCGGWGYQIGDEASAYWIARQLLAVFSKQADGRLEKTQLYTYVKEQLGLVTDYDIISYVSTTLENKREQIAALAVLVYDLAKQGDRDAIAIYQNCAREIALVVNTLAKLSDAPKIPFSYIGGVWKSIDLLEPMLKVDLDERVELITPKYTAEYGAYLLAKEQL